MALFTPSLQPALDSDGDTIGGAKWYFYGAGGTTPRPVYTSASLTTSRGAVVTANGAGRFPIIFLSDAFSYRAILKDAAGTTITDIDPVNELPGVGSFDPADLETFNDALDLLGEEIDEVAGGLEATNTQLGVTNANLGGYQAQTDSRLGFLEGINAGSRLATLETSTGTINDALTAYKQQTDPRLDFLEANGGGGGGGGPSVASGISITQGGSVQDEVTSVRGRLDNLEDADVAADARLDSLEAADTAQGGLISALDTRTDALEAADVILDGRIDTLEAINADARLDALEGDGGGAGIADAPEDDGIYVRQNATWIEEPVSDAIGVTLALAGDGTTNDATALSALLTARAGKAVTLNKTYYINSTVTIPRATTLIGHMKGGECFKADLSGQENWVYGDDLATIILGPSGKIEPGDRVGFKNLQILSSAVITPPANQADYTTRRAAWTQTAIEVKGQDVTVTDCFFMGFAKGILSDGWERGTYQNNKFDCLTNIDISDVYDTCRLQNNHGYPYWGAHRGYTALATLEHNQYGIHLHGHCDAGIIHGNTMYGFKHGCWIDGDLTTGGMLALRVTDNCFDSTYGIQSTVQGSGLELTGQIRASVFSNNHCDSYYTNYDLDYAAGGPYNVFTGNTSGQSRTAVRFGLGNGIFTNFMCNGADMGGTGGNDLYFVDGCGHWHLDNVLMQDSYATTCVRIQDEAKGRVTLSPSVRGHNTPNDPTMVSSGTKSPAFAGITNYATIRELLRAGGAQGGTVWIKDDGTGTMVMHGSEPNLMLYDSGGGSNLKYARMACADGNFYVQAFNDAGAIQNTLFQTERGASGFTRMVMAVPIRPPAYTVATLPSSPTTGDTAIVTDSTTTTYRAVVTGGGSSHVKVCYLNGSWRVG